MSRWLAITVLVFMSVLGVASVAGCGGSGIPDDVEWDVVDSSDKFTVLGMGNVGVGLRVRISREVSEDTLTAIANEARKKHVSKDAPNVVWFFLPGMDLYSYAWGRVETDHPHREDSVSIDEEIRFKNPAK